MTPRLFGPRHIVGAAVVVAAPLVALGAGLSTWSIVGVGAAAFVLVAAAERALAGRPEEPVVALAEPEPEPVEPEATGAVRVLRPRSEPVALAPAPTNVVPIGSSRLTIWDLEELAKQHAEDDPAAHEERLFLLVHLREFADVDGQLPSRFDPLVRASFGELVR